MQNLKIGTVEFETAIHQALRIEAAKIRTFLNGLNSLEFPETRDQLVKISALLIANYITTSEGYCFDEKSFLERGTTPRDEIEITLLNMVK